MYWVQTQRRNVLGLNLEKKCIGFKHRERNVLGLNLEKKCIGF